MQVYNASTLVRAFTTCVHALLDLCTLIWSLSLVGTIEHVESVQRAFTKCLTKKKCLSVLCLESLKLRYLKADLIMYFKILKWYTNITLNELFTWSSSSTRSHSMKLYYPDSRVTARQHYFSVRVVQLWNGINQTWSSRDLRRLETHFYKSWSWSWNPRVSVSVLVLGFGREDSVVTHEVWNWDKIENCTLNYNNTTFKVLHPLLEKVFCPPVTSAPVERISCRRGLLMRVNRARMGDNMLSQLVYLRRNNKF